LYISLKNKGKYLLLAVEKRHRHPDEDDSRVLGLTFEYAEEGLC
jgi:hypothetical protein